MADAIATNNEENTPARFLIALPVVGEKIVKPIAEILLVVEGTIHNS